MDITLSIFLFIIVFSFLCWLTTPVNQAQTSTIQQPIEQQFKEVLQEIDQELEEDSGESAVGSQKEEFPDSLPSQSPSKLFHSYHLFSLSIAIGIKVFRIFNTSSGEICDRILDFS
jgi:hypothetical protein